MRQQTRPRFGIIATLAALALITTACGGDGTTDQALGEPGDCQETVPVTFRMNWVFNYNQIPMQVAQEKGFYEEQCLEVKLEAGKGSGDTATNVGSGAAEVGMADAVAIIQAQAKELPLTGVAVLWQQNSFAVVIRDPALGTGSPEPTDLYGLTHGAVTTGSPYIFWKAFVNQQDLDTSRIKEVSIAPPGFAEMAQGSVDFITNFRGVIYNLNAAGVEATLLEAAEFGQEGYGLAVFANDRWLQENPEAMERFLTATAQGMVWSAEHPEEAIDILEKLNPAVGKSEEARQAELLPFKDSLELWTSEGPEVTDQYLQFTTEGLEATRDLLYDGEILKGDPLPVEDFWTDEYLPDPSAYEDAAS